MSRSHDEPRSSGVMMMNSHHRMVMVNWLGPQASENLFPASTTDIFRALWHIGCVMAGPATALQAIRLCVFDVRRGQREGQEGEKILYFFPEKTPAWEQLALAGLAEGLITFTRVFSPNAPCDVMDAEKHTHVFLECEPHVWMVLAAEKGGQGGIGENLRMEALRDVLREAYSLFSLFYGPISALLHEDQLSSGSAKRCLAAFFPDYFSGGPARRNWKLPTIAEGLTERGAVQLLPVDRQTFLNVQSIVGCLQTSQKTALGIDSVFMFHDMLLSTTLSPKDTSPLCTYSKLRLIPSSLSSTAFPSKSITRNLFSSRSSPSLQVPDGSAQTNRDATIETVSANPPAFGRSKLRSLFRSAAGKVPIPKPIAKKKPVFSNQSERYNSGQDPSNRHSFSPHTTSSTLSQGATSRPSRARFSSITTPQAMKLDAWYRKNDGYLGSSAWGESEGHSLTPTVHINPTKDSEGDDGWREMVVFQHKGLTVMVLNAIGVGAKDAAMELLESVAHMLEELEEVLSKLWGGPVASHIKGHRYLCIDRGIQTVRASPPVKVTTLSKESLSLLNQLRQEADWDSTRRLCRDGGEHDDNGEICVRGKNNAWVMSRRAGDSVLWTVMERASETLLLAAEAVEQMNIRHFDGVFTSS